MATNIKVLRKGDEVLQIDWSDAETLRFAVRRKNGEVDLYSLILDEDGLPRLDREHHLKITFGKDEVEMVKPGRSTKEDPADSSRSSDNDVKVSTF